MITKKLKDGSVFIYDENIECKIGGIVNDLLAVASKIKDWGVIAPLILSKDNKIVWHGGYIAPNLNMPMSYGVGESYIGQYPGDRSVMVVPFYCAIISKRLIKKIGLDDELGDNIFDDANYCMQAIANDLKIIATDVVSVKRYTDEGTPESINKYSQKLIGKADMFAGRWANILNKHYKLPVCFQTRVSAPTGFAIAVGNYMKSLSEAGIEITYNFIGGAPETEPAPADLFLTAITEKKGEMDMPQIIWGQAPLFFKNSGKYKIGHCEFEGEELPKSWVPYCNMMDELWVPTKWDREKLIKAGVNKPIYIIQQGIDPDYFHPKILPMRIEIPQTFKFICTAAWLPRKNLGNLMKVFAKTFSKNDDVCLIIKTMNLGLVESIEEEIKKLGIPDDSAYIYIKEEDWPASHLPSFYTMGQCFVLPTHGEGWGLPIFEALACGIPVITTGYGAPNEVLRDKENNNKPLPGVHLLDYTMVHARTKYEYLKDSNWAAPNLNQLSEKLLYVYENYQKEKCRALKTSDYIRKEFDWKNCVKPIIARLEDIYKKGF